MILKNVVFSEETVFQALKNMKSSFSRDPDGFLKKLSFSLCKPLCRVFEFSFNVGKVPEQWKKAFAVPLHKKGDLSKTENFRPVSLSSVPCKLMESVTWDLELGLPRAYESTPGCESN